MTNQGIRILDMVLKANTANTDTVLVCWNYGANTAQTALVSVATLLTQNLITDPPANNTLTVSKGQFFFSNNYIYVAVANNYLKRVSLADF